MKDWQKGYELDFLIEKTKEFQNYNKFSCSPFSEVKKNDIPTYLEENTYQKLDGCVFLLKTAKVRSPIKMMQDIVIGIKEPGDNIIEKLSIFSSEGYQNFLQFLNNLNNPVWIETWTEDFDVQNLLDQNDSTKKIGTKISTFAELKTFWFIDGKNTIFERDHPVVPEYELYNLTKLKLDREKIIPLVSQIKSKLSNLPEFINHYSNYNKGKSWSALSLRGYRPEPNFMTKPSEMNKKWKEENRDVQFEMQDTTLYEDFPEVRELVNMLNSNEIHRIRFMKLKKNEGELERHTDLVDEDSGVSDGKLLRIHFPIQTNPKVEFTSWKNDGTRQVEHMAFGEAWFLDTRKPHRAINAGDEDRIHLVVDVVANDNVRNLL